jgi:hypothetical protein
LLSENPEKSFEYYNLPVLTDRRQYSLLETTTTAATLS